ncbi:S8 family serine peptidase [Mesobacillus harenae]|uniref:S8 family serine peptidase n=1 Tax=Mesobacillus harenae TaxID=2213203 RepID=UPI00157FD710|nr:S8 family serine peptidase [Mesobacillus harenae]
MKLGWSFRKMIGISFTLMLLFVAAIPAFARVQNDDRVISAHQDNEYAYVQFDDQPIASYAGSINGYESTKPPKGQKLNLNSSEAKKYGKRLEAQRENYKKWLAKQLPQVEVVTEYAVTYHGIGLKLNGASLKEVSRGPGVMSTGYSGTYQKAMSESTTLINAEPIWNALRGQEKAGKGIKVGIIDSGIDQAHEFLQPNEGMIMPEGYPKGDTSLTTKKVIAAKVFHQEPWHTAKAVDSHGTHVAGTVAGKAGTVPLLGDKTLSGVAPGAYLGNYNVFPGAVEDAKSLFIAKAVEEAVMDGMDVLNLSLGGTPHKGADLLDMTVNAAVDAGVVVAISAGNSGPGNYTVGSPGTADKVITVAATTNSRSFAMYLISDAFLGSGGRTVATTGTQGGEVKEELLGEYAVWADFAGGDKLACTPITGKPLKDKLAVIQRGTCAFATKINNAAAAGAKGVIIYQLDGVNEPIPMSSDGAEIPAIMIGNEAGKNLIEFTDDRNVTITYPLAEIEATPNLLANFSSWGPTPNYTLKPDLAAPGVNIYSSVVGGGYELYQGTSMASPHVAGAAALLLANSQANQLNWGPVEVKSALMGTAQDLAGSVLPDTDVSDPLKVGAGLIDLGQAMSPPAMAMPSSLSFGLVRPVGNQNYQMTFTLMNPSDGPQMFNISADNNLSLSDSEVTLGPHESAQVTVTVQNRGTHTGGQKVTPNYERGYITVTSGNGNIRIPYLYLIDYNR